MAFRIVATLLCCLTFCLILLGGIVHSSGSSLACPDWPLCYGQFFPEMVGGVAIEHSHRLLASLIGILTIVLAVLATRQEDRQLERLSFAALILVVVQGVFGGITVLYQLPTAISTAHLSIAMLFFSLILWMTLKSYPAMSRDSRTLSVRPWVLIMTLLIYGQIILGALVRHTGASVACPDLPFCYGMAWPIGLHPATQLHMLHRWSAVLVTLVILSTCFFVLQQAPQEKRLRFFALNAVLLVFLQIGLGSAGVATQMNMAVVTAHLAGGVLLLATAVTMCLLTRQKASA